MKIAALSTNDARKRVNVSVGYSPWFQAKKPMLGYNASQLTCSIDSRTMSFGRRGWGVLWSERNTNI